VREETIVQDQTRDREGVLALCAFEGEVSQLDLHLLGIDHRSIGRDKGPVPPRRGGQQAQERQHEGALCAERGWCLHVPHGVLVFPVYLSAASRASRSGATAPHTRGSPPLACHD